MPQSVAAPSSDASDHLQPNMGANELASGGTSDAGGDLVHLQLHDIPWNPPIPSHVLAVTTQDEVLKFSHFECSHLMISSLFDGMFSSKIFFPQ